MKKLFAAVVASMLLPALASAQPDTLFPHSAVLPHWAEGAAIGLRISTEVLVINNSRELASGRVRFIDDEGASVEAIDFSINADSALRVKSSHSGALRTGWARVDSSIPLATAATFTVYDEAGAFLSRVGVGAVTSTYGFLIPVDTTDGKESGVALCNPDQEHSLSVLMRLLTMDGQTVATKSIELPPGGHRAEFVTESFPQGQATGFKGALWVGADGRFSALTLRVRGVDYTSLPTSSPADAAASTYEAFFPRVANGKFGDQAFRTSIWLLSPSAESKATVEFYRSDGSPWSLRINGQAAAEQVKMTIPVGGAVELTTDGEESPGVVGWARVTSDRRLGSGATFTFTDYDGMVSEVGVPAAAQLKQQLIYVREQGATGTGVALTNVTVEPVTVRLRLFAKAAATMVANSLELARPLAVNPVAEKIVSLPARSHVGQFVFELFAGVPAIQQRDFEGWLEIRPHVTRFGEDIMAPVAAMTLLAEGVKLTTLPTAPRETLSRPLSYWDAEVDSLLASMTLEEKVGQMTQAERGSLEDESDIQTYFLGSVLSGGGSGPSENNAQAWAEMYDRFQTRALNTRLKIPLLYGIDALHGHNNVRGAVIFPHNIGLGATRNAALVEQAARITASEVRATGINWTFSPVVAVPQDERWGRTYEGFGEEPSLVQMMGEAATRGYQGDELADSASILACAKHFLADGGTEGGVDQGNAVMDEAELRLIHLPGYLGAMEAGVGSIMVSFSSWNGLKMSANHYLLTTVLKEELGFEGFLVSDWAAIDQLPGDYRQQVKTAVNAGLDMFMVPYRHREFFETLRSLAVEEEVPMSRIDDAVRRILRVKYAMGLLSYYASPWPPPSPLTDASFQARFGSAEHREVAREAVRQSLVLLKNQGEVLPLSKTAARILVAGSKANDVGSQCGGWTIDWQGQPGDITPGTTILEALRNTASPETSVVFSPSGAGAEGADAAVVVIGESPYAEGLGDDQDLSLSQADIAAVENANAAGVPVVVVLISGRPLILAPILDKADGLVAAWLPGTEGQGVADVLFGDYKPTGKLPCSWPKGVSQIPINIVDVYYDPLFPHGFGLTYE